MRWFGVVLFGSAAKKGAKIKRKCDDFFCGLVLFGGVRRPKRGQKLTAMPAVFNVAFCGPVWSGRVWKGSAAEKGHK